MNKNPSVRMAIDHSTGELVDSHEIFKTRDAAFELRTRYNTNQAKYFCPQCDQDLVISSSRKHNIHFKHFPKSAYCILKDGNLTELDIEVINEATKAKESERHKYLKNLIGDKLKKTEGVNINSISIDNKYIIEDGEKRRPDVYFEYLENKIVFEIQLSKLSLRYIRSRYDFYKEHGIYLIWILQDIDTDFQEHFELDIKYLTEQENFFTFEESQDKLTLLCRYKYPEIINNKIIADWRKTYASLAQLKFDPTIYQAYYFNFDAHSKILQTRIKEKLAINEKNKYLEEINKKVTDIISEISRLKKLSYASYDPLKYEIDNLSDDEIIEFNKSLNLKRKSNGRTPVSIWISQYEKDKNNDFLQFILSCKNIHININEIDDDGQTILQAILKQDIYSPLRIIKNIFSRGYIFSESDKEFLKKKYDITEAIARETLYNYAHQIPKELIDDLFKFSRIIYIIESIKRKQFINSGHTNWLAYVNYNINNITEYWHYFEKAYKKYSMWDKIVTMDKKGTFRRKVNEYNQTKPVQNKDCDSLLRAIYPELFN